jgi:hypothetical protein
MASSGMPQASSSPLRPHLAARRRRAAFPHLLAAGFLLLAAVLHAQTPLAPNAPKDKPTQQNKAQAEALAKAIAPFIAQARASYPDAKKRYLAGLPPKHIFFLTTRLRDQAGHYEQIFVEVQSIADGKVTGIIASDILGLQGFKRGDTCTFPEAEMLDWLIAKPDGSEEGNVVGKFLDTYHP